MSARSNCARPPWRLLQALFGLMLAWPGQALACDLALRDTSAAIRLDYDPFAAATPPGVIRFTLTNRSGQDCQARVALRDLFDQPQPVLLVGEPALSLAVRPTSRQLSPTVEPGVFAVQLAENQSLELELALSVVEDVMVQAGVHDVDALLAAWVDAPSSALSSPIRVTVAAAPRAQLNLAGAAGDFGADNVGRIDFGLAESSASRRLYLQVRANAASRVTVTSENRGRLLLQTEADEAPAPETRPHIAYTLTLDAQPVDLSAPADVDVDPPRTYRGRSMEMILQLQDVPPGPAGRYQDLITFEVRTL
ncbi:hypothetical protein [Brevundimonas sp. PAMC22021]|uniref:hypothetical protein n=1 Tax=Brevundimonas sp. PAMC22021 TaxID=2861285 RepID=UPI001C624D19|nr:hypothetical protein [Brevundimonas sp. PAMC22021]QYF85962.1 hypothetical protein KY493_08780 [Brevundimonas sp. PAMC22021]